MFDKPMKQVSEILMAIIGVAIISVLIKNSDGAAKIISSAGNAFSGILNTALMQGKL